MPAGMVTTYDLTQGVIVDIDPLIRQLAPLDTPLQSGVGSDGSTILASNSCFEKKVEWQDDEILTPRSTLAGAATTGDVVITVAAGHQLRFQTGDALLIGSEQVRVTGYGATADTLLISRAFAGTAAGSLASAADVVNLGATLPEGSNPPNARSQDRTGRFNLTQIFGPTAVHVSGTENAIRKYGLTGTEFDYQAMLRAKEENIKVEQALIYGTRFEDAGNKLREMGGLVFYITVNVNSSAVALTDVLLLDQIQACYDAGGNPNRCLVGSKQKRVISNFNSGDIRLGRMDVGRGKTVDYFDSDFGRVDFTLHRRARATDLFLFNREQATIRTLRPWQFKMLGDTGDAQTGMLVAEKTLQFEADRWAARFSALT